MSSIGNKSIINFRSVETYQHVDDELFNQIVSTGEPAILKSCDFGDCFKKWTLSYLKDRLQDKSIVIHESEESEFDFINKNFKYQSTEFADFAAKLENPNRTGSVYLRSTNKDPRSKCPAHIADDFQSLAQDLKPPDFIPYGNQNALYHSSVLRIASSNVQIWTHFDLYDNVLCQMVGHKRVVLFPPTDIEHLYIVGDKSPVSEFDDWNKCVASHPKVAKTSPYICNLNPGDVLYIPSLWWHNIKTLSTDNQSDPSYSIGINVFWKDGNINNGSIYAKNDVYGNKNLAPFDAALANLDKAINHLDKLPEKYRTFFKFMLFKRMKEKIFPK